MERYLISIVLILLLSNCRADDKTPAGYVNNNKVENHIYYSDRTCLLDSVKEMLVAKRGPFYPQEDDSLTEVSIDTIYYDSTKNRVAFYVVAKNSNDKLIGGGDKHIFHYDAFCFVGYRTNKGFENVNAVSIYSSANFPSYAEVVHDISGFYIHNSKKLLGYGDARVYPYGIDDVRFWDNDFPESK